MRLWLVAVLVGASSCRSRPATPEAAFERLREAVEAGDALAIYDALEIESRWSVQTVHRTEQEMWRLVRAHFPLTVRAREEARYAAAGAAASPRDFFGSLGLHGDLRARMATARRFEPQPDGAVLVETKRGGRFVFSRGRDGSWGYKGLAAELQRRKDHAVQALALIQQSAQEYRREGH